MRLHFKICTLVSSGTSTSPLRSQQRRRNSHSRLWHKFSLFSTLFVLLAPIDLIPTAQYPRQLQQAISLLNNLIQNLHKSPSNIILYGDAAGGNLTTAVLSHLSHPHPSKTTLITPLKLTAKLRGLVLSSPGFPSHVLPPPSPTTPG
jgi:acetyl esterase/lipase